MMTKTTEEPVTRALNILQMWIGILMLWLIGLIPVVLVVKHDIVMVIYLCGGVVIAFMSIRSTSAIGDAL